MQDGQGGGHGRGQPLVGDGLFKLPDKKERCCVICSKPSLQAGGKMKNHVQRVRSAKRVFTGYATHTTHAKNLQPYNYQVR